MKLLIFIDLRKSNWNNEPEKGHGKDSAPTRPKHLNVPRSLAVLGPHVGTFLVYCRSALLTGQEAAPPSSLSLMSAQGLTQRGLVPLFQF